MKAWPLSVDRNVSVALGLALLCVAFGLATVWRVWPFVDDLASRGPAEIGDDWEVYRAQAIDIIHGGLTIPTVDGAYVRPAGFLYNYFVAFVFVLFGENSAYVYVVQAIMLGGSIALYFAIFRRTAGTFASAIFVVALTAMMLVDVFRFQTVRLLSENLLLFLFPLGLLLVMEALRRGSYVITICAGIFIGLGVLTRPNVILIPLALALVWAFLNRRQRFRSIYLPVVFLAGCTAVLVLLPLRNLAVTGEWHLTSVVGSIPSVVALQPRIPEANSGTAITPIEGSIRIAASRILFTLGYAPALEADFRPRPHWMAMWVAFGLGIVVTARRRWVETWQAMGYAVVIAYLAPLLLTGALSSYGGRMVTPIWPLVLMLGMPSIECLRGLWIRGVESWSIGKFAVGASPKGSEPG